MVISQSQKSGDVLQILQVKKQHIDLIIKKINTAVDPGVLWCVAMQQMMRCITNRGRYFRSDPALGAKGRLESYQAFVAASSLMEREECP